MSFAALTLETVGGFSTWPVRETTAASSGVTTTALGTRDATKYAGLGLTGADFIAGTGVKIVGKKKKWERPVIKRWKGTVIAVIYYDASQASKNEVLILDGFTETVASFGATWGQSVARWNDELEDDLMYIGFAVCQFCTLVKYGLKMVDCVVEELD
ncbi:hypothetical protein Aspvir_002193 [Aspergillus viridinutans]|uniref:Uncharacterized protein n=1 Tax=Aspergillus viridinutans TaxID=75553 RepID=A0A9P3C5E8_ASPVI|nr:uncharacterized protein Aspvir_002193 [Aspergillus viridinutans]GIK06543.1 hypothetical protein Aspvir_002193 [Aspergillus viridinutans]